MHNEAERIYKINHPYSITEFPLGMKLEDGILITGSIDVVEFNDNDTVDIIDFKSSSQWTFPYTEESKNPTHFNQVYIYAYWLGNFVLSKKIRRLKVVYLNKHEQYTGEQIMDYDNDIGREIFINYISRVKKLHTHLLELKLIFYEPHKWCKYCNYRFRCRDNIIFDENLKEISLEDIEHQYQKETGKSPRWRGNYTKAFKKYKEGYRIV